MHILQPAQTDSAQDNSKQALTQLDLHQFSRELTKYPVLLCLTATARLKIKPAVHYVLAVSSLLESLCTVLLECCQQIAHKKQHNTLELKEKAKSVSQHLAASLQCGCPSSMHASHPRHGPPQGDHFSDVDQASCPHVCSVHTHSIGPKSLQLLIQAVGKLSPALPHTASAVCPRRIPDPVLDAHSIRIVHVSPWAVEPVTGRHAPCGHDDQEDPAHCCRGVVEGVAGDGVDGGQHEHDRNEEGPCRRHGSYWHTPPATHTLHC